MLRIPPSTVYNPARFILAQLVFWAIWGPFLLIAIPFALFAWFIEWVHEDAFPFIANASRPPFTWALNAATKTGALVLGKRKDVQ